MVDYNLQRAHHEKFVHHLYHRRDSRCRLSIAGLMWALPHYSVWQQRLAGEVALARATQDRQIAVQEAQAKREAATMLAEAEIERAKGVAEANRIIGDSLQNNEEYLRYLFVNNLENTRNQVIYVPTEANLPILEATRNSK